MSDVHVHPTAFVADGATLDEGVRVGPFSIVHDNATIGAGTSIGAYCEIGHPTDRAEGRPLTIGARAIIRSHSVLYQGSEIGDGLRTGHHVTIRELTSAGPGFQVGTLGDIQGTCTIGQHVRLHSNVHIGQHSTVGDFVWIFPYVVLTNDPHPPSTVMRGTTVEDFAAIATMSVILPGIVVGRGALVGAHSSVTRDVEPETVVAGVPARSMGPTSAITLRDGSGHPAYPWRRHYHVGYPAEIVETWKQEEYCTNEPRLGLVAG